MVTPTIHEMAAVARAWLREQRVYRYNLRKISDMDDREVLQKCHFWNEENHMTREFQQFERARLYARSDETEESS